MPVRMITDRIIEIGTSLFLIVGSAHFDLPKPIAKETAAAVQNITETAETAVSESFTYNLTAGTVSVSCVKLKWIERDNEEYTVTVTQTVPDDYIDNVDFVFKSEGVCYVTGLREGTEYLFEICDSEGNLLDSTTGKTETVEIIEEFEYEDGRTNCFSYENAKGLTRNPSYSAIQGAFPDSITGTGIMRDEYGDYCVAMGTYYGYCGDRFLVTLENGVQFTVKICDSKGDRRYHDFGNNGKSIIEFIHADRYLPDCVKFTGNYGCFNWSGLDLGANIRSIQKINYGEKVEY